MDAPDNERGKEPKYGREVFEALVEAFGLHELRDYYTIKRKGVCLRVIDEHYIVKLRGVARENADKAKDLQGIFFSPNWAPACDLGGPDNPDPLNTPALPFPFTAKQLAAFMLDGWGASIAECAGELGGVPDEDTLAELSERQRKVREALIAAYGFIRVAQAVVGPPPHRTRMAKIIMALADRATRTPDLRERATRLARVLPKQDAVERARVTWRQAMVEELLGQSSATQGLATAEEPELQGLPFPGDGLTTDQVCDAFDSIGMTSIKWRTMLNKNRPNWLMRCRTSKGRRGASPLQATWSATQIATALAQGECRHAGVIAASQLDAAFRRPLLMRVATAWAAIRQDNPAWGD